MPLRYRIADAPWASLDTIDTLHVPAGQTLCFDVASGGCWYGHGFAHRQPFPLNREAIVSERFAANNTLCPVWMAQSGTVIWRQTDYPLRVRLLARGGGDGGGGGDGEEAGTLDITPLDRPAEFRFFHGPNLPAAQRDYLRAIGWPAPFTSAAQLRESFFCTWTQFPKTINQERARQMARAIREHGYPASTLILDDHWEAVPGDLAFGPHFPEPKALIDELHGLGFKVWLWVCPFINANSANFAALARQGFLVRKARGEEPSLLKWWNGEAGLIDLTNPEAADWYRGRLAALTANFGVDGFKLDGGDAKYQPPAADSRFYRPIGPSGYADLYLALAESLRPARPRRGRCGCRRAATSCGARAARTRTGAWTTACRRLCTWDCTWPCWATTCSWPTWCRVACRRLLPTCRCPPTS